MHQLMGESVAVIKTLRRQPFPSKVVKRNQNGRPSNSIAFNHGAN